MKYKGAIVPISWKVHPEEFAVHTSYQKHARSVQGTMVSALKIIYPHYLRLK